MSFCAAGFALQAVRPADETGAQWQGSASTCPLFEVGSNTALEATQPAAPSTVMPFAFTGKLAKLTLTIDRPKLSPEDEKRLAQAQRNNNTSE
jgi:hypothetical protein